MIHESFKNSYKVENKLLSALTVYNTGAQKCEPLYQWGPGVRDHYLIHYVVSGQGFYQDILAQTIYSLKAGDVFMVFPGREVLYYAHKQDPWEYVWVGFNGTDAKIMAGAAGFSLHRPVIRSCAFGSELHKMLTKIYNCRGNTLASAVDMTGLLYSTLSLFIHDHPTSSSPDGYEIYVHKATDYIHSHFSYPVSIEEIADYIGISRSHLHRAFRQVLGQSPKEYLTNFRIRQACMLLENTKLSITSIANSTGFESSLYFSRAFKNKKQMTPSHFRETLHHQLPDEKKQPSNAGKPSPD